MAPPMLRTCLIALGAVLTLATAAEAKRYVGQPYGNLEVSSAVTRVRWQGSSQEARWMGAVLKARYRCRAGDAAFQPVLCPNSTRGKILAEMQHPGDFYGWLVFKDGTTCRVAGSLTSLDSVLWEQGLPPQQAPRMTLYLDCGQDPDDGEDGFSFVGEVPQN